MTTRLVDLPGVRLHIEDNALNARGETCPHVANVIGMEVPGELAPEIVGFLSALPR